MGDNQIIPKQFNNYWIYVMSNKIFKEFEKNNNMNLSTFYNYNLRRSDIIFIFIKKAQSGFIGICRVGTNQVFNKDIAVFKDINLNKYLFTLNYATFFDKVVQLKAIFPTVKADIEGYDTERAFTKAYLREPNSMNKLDYNGEKLLNKLYELTKMPDVMNVTVSKPVASKTNKKKKKELKNSDDTLTDSEDSKMSECNKRKKDQAGKIKKKLDNQSINIIDTENDSEGKKEDSGPDEDEISVTEIKGMIPIMIVPCKDFSLPKKKKEEYFRDHYKFCKKCDITNNNNLELCSVLDTLNISFTDDLDENFAEALKCYDETIAFAYDSNNMTIYEIKNDECDIYNDCLLIVWNNNIKN